MRKTEVEIKALMENWFADPCWDIEDTEGFEAHRQALLEFRLQSEAQWAEKRHRREQAEQDRREALAEIWGVAGAGLLVEKIERLEARILELEEQVFNLRCR